MNCVTISIDPRKHRIRLHKDMLYKMGSPKYVQLLVNPDKRMVAIAAANKASMNDSVHKVDLTNVKSDISIELYSLSFVKKLNEVIGNLKDAHSYRLAGKVMPSNKVAVFSLDTVTIIGG